MDAIQSERLKVPVSDLLSQPNVQYMVVDIGGYNLMLYEFSIITQVIIEILGISLVEDYVISCYNHLTRGDYSGSTNFQTAAWRFVDVSEEETSTMKENAIPKGIKDAAKSRVTLFEGRIWKFC